MANTKPFVQVACLCEHILIENDGVATAVRIIDTYTFETHLTEIVAGAPEHFKPALHLHLFVSLKSGDLKGHFNVGIQFRRDSGETIGDLRQFPVVFEGGPHGANVKADVIMPIPKEGLYWFDVLWSAEPLTSVPLRIAVRPPTAEQQAPTK